MTEINPKKHKNARRASHLSEDSIPTLLDREGITAHVANKVEATGRMVKYVTHEIRNSLAIINSNAQYALDYVRHVECSGNKILDESLTTIINAVKLVNKFTSELAEVHSFEFVKEETTIRHIIKKALDLLKVEIDKKKIRVTSEFLSRIPRIIADKERLKQVFVNILLNAIQAVRTGGSIEIKTKWDTSTKSIIIQFEDTGPGIPEEYIEKIFEPFTSLKEGYKGLGLAICSMVINAHGGTIVAENMAKGGARFTVVLPALEKGIGNRE